MQDLIVIDSKKLKVRLLLSGVTVMTLFFAWFAVTRQLGSMIANLTSPENPEAPLAAKFASDLAPGDPVAKWLSASAGGMTTDEAFRIIEDAVRLSPFDYRWRVELGRAYEQTDKIELAESSFERAVGLAPTYAFPHWHLGNFYLRQARTDEAFAELKKAAENNRTYRDQVFSLAWDYFDKDPAEVEQLAEDTPDARANLALFFAARGRASEALRIWNLLSDDEKALNPQIAKAIAHGLFIQRHFPQALEFARQLGFDADAKPEVITNAGFERVVGAQDDSRFDWLINRNEGKLDITTDSSVRHSGSRSLRISFRNYIKTELCNVFQTVVVEPNKNYRLTFWLRTENLKSSGGPLLQIVNAVDDKPMVLSKAFQTGTNDWQEYSLDFRTPENCSGIVIRTVRTPCGDQCPLAGTLWYDDFELNKP